MYAEKTSVVKPKRMAPLLILVAVFALPMLAAWILFLNPNLVPAGKSNHGTLVSPPLAFPDMAFQAAGDQRFSRENLLGFWTLVTIGRTNCGRVCREDLHQLRQVHLALGKDGYRVRRLLVLPGGVTSQAQVQALLDIDRNLTVITDSGEQTDTLIDLFAGVNEAGDDYRFLIDPLGNLMMVYAPSIPAADILKDMKKLLKVSRNWHAEVQARGNKQ